MKKDSRTIHREHAEQKAKRDKERATAGDKPHKGISMGPSHKQENPLSNPIAQALAFAIRLHNRQSKSKQPKQYEHRKT